MTLERVRFDFGATRVLITGGSNGIGLAVAAAFADCGASVTVTGTRPRPVDYDHDLSAFEYRQLDVRDAAAVDALAAGIDHLDVLVNNAGANLPMREWSPDVFEESVSINLFSAFRLAVGCKASLAKSELAGGASVLNVASMASFFAAPVVPGYGAAKAGIVQMTSNLAVSWGGEGIRVNAVAPGLIETGMTAPMKGIDALEKPQLERTPLRRWGTTKDLVGAFLFLASPAAAFITGQTLCVDGGYSVA